MGFVLYVLTEDVLRPVGLFLVDIIFIFTASHAVDRMYDKPKSVITASLAGEVLHCGYCLGQYSQGGLKYETKKQSQNYGIVSAEIFSQINFHKKINITLM